MADYSKVYDYISRHPELLTAADMTPHLAEMSKLSPEFANASTAAQQAAVLRSAKRIHPKIASAVDSERQLGPFASLVRGATIGSAGLDEFFGNIESVIPGLSDRGAELQAGAAAKRNLPDPGGVSSKLGYMVGEGGLPLLASIAGGRFGAPNVGAGVEQFVEHADQGVGNAAVRGLMTVGLGKAFDKFAPMIGTKLGNLVNRMRGWSAAPGAAASSDAVAAVAQDVATSSKPAVLNPYNVTSGNTGVPVPLPGRVGSKVVKDIYGPQSPTLGELAAPGGTNELLNTQLKLVEAARIAAEEAAKKKAAQAAAAAAAQAAAPKPFNPYNIGGGGTIK